MNRRYDENITVIAAEALDLLINNDVDVSDYRKSMRILGEQLGQLFCKNKQEIKSPVLVVSTAEDTDYLTKGFLKTLKNEGVEAKIAVFWNHHYPLQDKSSVAPVLNQYLEVGYQKCSHIVMMKSIISGSCVIQTNLVALMNDIGLKDIADIAVVAPVMHVNAKEKLKKAFSDVISEKFNFYFFAIDSKRDGDGIVHPGIGGDVYSKLGLAKQPSVIGGFLPELVKIRLFSS